MAQHAGYRQSNFGVLLVEGLTESNSVYEVPNLLLGELINLLLGESNLPSG